MCMHRTHMQLQTGAPRVKAIPTIYRIAYVIARDINKHVVNSVHPVCARSIYNSESIYF